MSNILHDLKNDFVIVGLTGPLRSGCSTAANFFSKKLNKYISTRNTKTLPKIEVFISQKYKRINELKSEIDKLLTSTQSYKAKIKQKELSEKLTTITKRLKKYLELREIISVLKDYKENNFKYISFTELLLKITIESIIRETI
jgi:hypothetical protein